MSKKLKELKADYLLMADLTEVHFANKHFGDYEAWLQFVDKNLNQVSMWRKELELTLKQEAYGVVIETMRQSPKEALQAAKFLLSKGILTRDGEASVMATEEEVVERVKTSASRVDNDYLRLVVNGAK
jgi:primase-polymerase (primpol)-like protein